MSRILDQYGVPMVSETQALQNEIMGLRRQILKGKYDAAQDTLEGQQHWLQADHLDPHASASYTVRRKLRSRSRYEVLENNPYLKGTILTIVNDFVGDGPRLRVTDKRLSKAARQSIEFRFKQYAKAIKLRKKLWRMRMAKIVDGETFGMFYINKRIRDPVQLDFTIFEAEQVSSQGLFPQQFQTIKNEIDGIRFDDQLSPSKYFVLHSHPGSQHFSTALNLAGEGDWVDAKFIIHWFRQDRGWLRGIPELTPSLPLCSILRRYTLAIVRWAETSASISGVIETEGPAGAGAWVDSVTGGVVEDDPFDTFPVERGMLMNLPWGYKMKQLDGVPLGVQYDEFVGAILREITRPLLTVYNLVIGSSKDSNMSGAVVDNHVYKGGQNMERKDCNEEVLENILHPWWELGLRTPDYFDDQVTGGANFLAANPSLRENPPIHDWGWDTIGLEHTDPMKVATGIQILHDKKILTDKDVQETLYNRDLEDWQEDILEQDEFRQQLTPEEESTPSSSPSEEKDE